MQLNEKQTPQPQPDGRLQPHRIPDKQFPLQQQAGADDNEDDPVLSEGYLPEIYFSLKSENPADW